ncbi:N-acetyltransferase, partial [Kineococcus glutinatus]|uniref:GNAT family N-acetyltransferase n=1 Tax=Kineococcus glutinatus TaxID=1070872 RepID=UPI0031EA5881
RWDGDVLAAHTLVAGPPGAVVGSVVCSRGLLGGRPAVGLGPLGVLPAHQRRGVGSALVHAALAAADALDEVAVLLLGAPGLYARFGFVPAADLGIRAPEPAWGEHFQVRTLTAWTPGRAGPFRCAPAFDRLGGEPGGVDR